MNRWCLRHLLSYVFVLLVGFACVHPRSVVAEVPRECEGPAWLRGDGLQGDRAHGVGSAEAVSAEPVPEVTHQALTGAVLDLLLRSNRGEMQVLSFFSKIAVPAALAGSDGARTLPAGLVERLGELVTRVRDRLDTEYWFDPCLRRLWCSARLDPDAVEKVTASLLARNDLDAVLDEALQALAAQTGSEARRLVIYQVKDRDGISEGKLGEAVSAALARVSTAKSRYHVVPREALEGILRSARTDVGGLAYSPSQVRTEIVEVLDLILLGGYWKDQGVVRLELVLVDPAYRTRGSVTTYVFETALPEPVRLSASEDEVRLREQKALEEAERRQEDEGQRRRDAEKYEELKREALAQVTRDDLPRLRAELDEQYRKQYDEKYQSAVAQSLASLREDLLKQGVAQEEALDLRLEAQRAQIEQQTQHLLALQAEVQKRRELDQRVESAALEAAALQFKDYVAGVEGDSPLRVSTYLDRGCGATYHVGEEAVLFTRCNLDCYVKVFHRSQDGEVTLLFPNRDDGNNHLKGGVVHAIGDESYPFLFRIKPPLGIERVVVVAQETQFDDIETIRAKYEAEGLAGYGKQDKAGYRGVLYRGMVPEARPGRAATGTARSTCSLVVEE